MKADLHLHTTVSDGLQTPSEVVRLALNASMDVIAITDHDQVQGFMHAQEALQNASLRILHGIEVSSGIQEVHILGYAFHPQNKKLAAFLQKMMYDRHERVQVMAWRARNLGMPIAMEALCSEDRPFVGRLQFARAMVAKGYAISVQQAFQRYLSEGKALYVPQKRMLTSDVIALLKSIGAFVSLAHPSRLSLSMEQIVMLLPAWQEAGLDAIEVHHSSHTVAERAAWDRIARRYRLLVTGGSDYHGEQKGPTIGAHLAAWKTVQDDMAQVLCNIEHMMKRSE